MNKKTMLIIIVAVLLVLGCAVGIFFYRVVYGIKHDPQGSYIDPKDVNKK